MIESNILDTTWSSSMWNLSEISSQWMTSILFSIGIDDNGRLFASMTSLSSWFDKNMTDSQEIFFLYIRAECGDSAF